MSTQTMRKKEIQQCALKLKKLSREYENRWCVDCGERNPTWVSVNIGCWLCLKCSGLHRNLGANYSFIKSTTMDNWNYKLLHKFKKLGGNKQTKIIYGNNMITNQMNDYHSLTFIRDKYIKKAFVRNRNKVQKQSTKIHQIKSKKHTQIKHIIKPKHKPIN
eukprot:167158_1